MIIHCGDCIAERAVHFMYEHCEKKEGSPTLDDYNRLKLWLESGYICVDPLGIPFYHTKEEHHCNNTTEPHYYKHRVTKEILDV